MIKKKILILANSRKHAGRCIAGIEVGVANNRWVRPVSDRPGEEISDQERFYANGEDPKKFDVVEIPLSKAVPHSCHTENWRIIPGVRWEKVDVCTWADACRLAEAPQTLWLNGQSSLLGTNDEIPTAQAKSLLNSICMIHVPTFRIHVIVSFGIRKVKAIFSYNNFEYKLSVTDPEYERQYLNKAIGTYELGEALFVISLSEPIIKSDGNSCQYKLVAAILCP